MVGPYIDTDSRWDWIEDIPKGWERLGSEEARDLARKWAEQKRTLKESELVNQFTRELVREWSIETGILERIYDLSRGVTQLLVQKGFDESLLQHGDTDRPPGEVIAILKDHEEAIDGLFAFVAGQRELDLSYIKQLHQVLCRHQTSCEGIDQFGNRTEISLPKGEWKLLPNNPYRDGKPVHRYCPPIHVQSEMERLITMHKDHGSVPPEIEAAWLHHRFTQIHPFQDGNGRVARCLATLIFLRHDWLPIVIRREDRSDYISALESADIGSLEPLVLLFGKVQARAFDKVLRLSTGVLVSRTNVSEAIKGLAALAKRNLASPLTQVEGISSALTDLARDCLQGISENLADEFRSVGVRLEARVARSNERIAHYYTYQITQTARSLDYFANTTGTREWTHLRLSTGGESIGTPITHFVVSFHHVGSPPSGLMAATAFLDIRHPVVVDIADPKLKSETQSEVVRTCLEPFWVSKDDKMDLTAERFKTWFERCMLIGLAEWRRLL